MPPSQESSPLLQGVLKVFRKNCRGKGQGQAPKLLSGGLIPSGSDGLDTDRGLRLHWEWRSGREDAGTVVSFHGEATAQLTLVPSRGQNEANLELDPEGPVECD